MKKKSETNFRKLFRKKTSILLLSCSSRQKRIVHKHYKVGHQKNKNGDQNLTINRFWSRFAQDL